ncbi:MAG TPA: tetratricopeptide repeat protein [Gemmataceae bacterium]|jgi:tetratricopeptide (TPR) repeat protein|nr:tetratricopeptide repeat protein [Gemmataceae bacterium]
MNRHRWLRLLAAAAIFGLSAGFLFADEPPRALLESAVQNVQSRNYAVAEKLFDALLAKQPDSVQALVGRGSCLLNRKAFEKALVDFTAACKLDPKNVAAWVGRGSANAEMQQWNEAGLAYNEALKLDSRSADAYVGRGGVRLSQGEIEKALADYDQALRVQANCAAAFVGRGAVRILRRDPAMAVADYNEALRLDPENVAALQGRGYAYFRQKDFARARSDFSEAVRYEPDNPDALNRLAWLLAVCPESGLREGKKALELARRACSLTQNQSPYFLDTLAAALAETGDFAEASKAQGRVIDLANKMDKESLEQARRRLTIYAERKPYREP